MGSKATVSESRPLAERIRPQTLKEFVGQEHLTKEDKPISLALREGKLHSMIFWGPPGCGKTTLARVIANELDVKFFPLSAVSAGKADVKEIITLAKNNTLERRVVLFLDEIHRFNKAQQDFLLPYVEDGTIIFIGATTENPSFEVISPLLSRCQVFVLEPLSEEHLVKILQRGIKELKKESQLSKKIISPTAQKFITEFANGDARQLLNLLEATTHLYGKITVSSLKNTLQSKFLQYDKGGEEHYNTISAYIKSLRASDVDAALYYLARMVGAGEDPLFIARRQVIFARAKRYYCAYPVGEAPADGRQP